MAEPLLIAPYFMDFILPFVLVFTLIFAILQKTKLLGDDNKRIDALIGAVIGLVLIAFPFARSIIVSLMPFLAVVAVILLVFMLLYGFITGKKEGDVLDAGWKVALVGLMSVALVVFLLYITGYWGVVYEYLFGAYAGWFWVNFILVVAIVGAVIAVLSGKEK